MCESIQKKPEHKQQKTRDETSNNQNIYYIILALLKYFTSGGQT